MFHYSFDLILSKEREKNKLPFINTKHRRTTLCRYSMTQTQLKKRQKQTAERIGWEKAKQPITCHKQQIHPKLILLES